MANGLKTIETRFADILANLPNRFVAGILKFIIQPFGAHASARRTRWSIAPHSSFLHRPRRASA